MKNDSQPTQFGTRFQEPSWVTIALVILRRPIHVWCAVFGLLIIALTFLLASLATGETIVGVAAMFCGLLAGTISAVYFVRSGYSSGEDQYADARSVPTLALIVLLVNMYSWLTLVAMSTLPDLLQIQIGDLKFFATLLLAALSFVYTQFIGGKQLAAHFAGPKNGKVKLTGTQAVLVVGFVGFVGAYSVWLIG